jgi:LacI family transcriptional regulator
VARDLGELHVPILPHELSPDCAAAVPKHARVFLISTRTAPIYSADVSENSSPASEGFVSPAEIFQSFETSAVAAEELEARATAMADQPGHERAAGHFVVGLATAFFEVVDINHPIFAGSFFGIRNRLVAGGCDLLFCATRPSRLGDPIRTLALKRTIERGVDGLIIWGFGARDPEVVTILESGLPAVFIDHDPIGARVGSVMSANVEAMGKVVHHLYENGRRRIAHITGQSNTRPGPDRLLGYRSELAKLGLPTRPEYIEEGDYFHRSGYKGSKRLLALPEPPDAITCASDVMAIAAMVAVAEAGLRVPEDIAVTGFDDAPFAATVKPSLTTVRQDSVGLGTAAAEAILRMLEHPDEPPPTVVLPAGLVIRESSGPPAPREH